MKFATESKMRTWEQAIKLQREKLAHPVPKPEEIPKTDFPWMKDHMAPFPNPYADALDDDSDDDYFATVAQPSQPRVPPPRFPIQNYSYPKPQADLAGYPGPLPPSNRYTAPAMPRNRSQPLPDDAITSQIPPVPAIPPHFYHPSRSPILMAPPRLGLRPLLEDEADSK